MQPEHRTPACSSSIRSQHGAGGEFKVFHFRHGNGSDLERINTGDVFKLAGDPLDFLQSLFVKNITPADLNHDEHLIGAAENIAYFVMDFDIGMILGQEVGKMSPHDKVGKLVQEKCRCYPDDDKERYALLNNKFSKRFHRNTPPRM